MSETTGSGTHKYLFGVVGIVAVVLLIGCVTYAYFSNSKSGDGYSQPEAKKDIELANDEISGQAGSSLTSNEGEDAKESGQDNSVFGWARKLVNQIAELITVAEDSTSGQKGSVQVFDLLASEKPKNGATFVVTSLELQLMPNSVAGTTLSQDRKQVTAPTEGKYVVQSNGAVQFTPESDFIGTAVGVAYTIRDTNGVNYQGKYKPRVIDTAPLSCNDPKSQGFWLARKTGYVGLYTVPGEDPNLTVKLQQLNAGGVNMSISSDGLRYFMIDTSGNVLRSTDGGVNWQHVGPDIDEYRSVNYVVSADGMVILMSFRMGTDDEGNQVYEHYRSDDGGDSWSPAILPSPVVGGSDSATLMSDSGSIIYQLSFNYYEEIINVWRSTDHGATWSSLDAVAGFNPNSYAISNDGTKLFISAYIPETMALPEPEHVVIKSTDGGATWTQSDPTTDFIGYGTLQVSGNGSRVLMLAYDFGRDKQVLYVSIDGGETWVEKGAPGDGIRLNGITLTNDGSRLLLAADDSNNDYVSLYYWSTDLGTSWTPITPPEDSSGGLIVSRDGDTIYGLGSDKTYVSTNAGASWTEMAPIYQPFNEYRVDLDVTTPESDYVLDKTSTEGWKLTYDPVTDDLVATVTDETKFMIPDEIVTDYTLAPLAGCANPVKGRIHFKYESIG